ncbi:IstB domain protein ATP-binding protein [Desulfotomaculum nigrificans CO-1-SRB]|uniref:IstB domain protein ATP-binding protein n=1 Tax=Desulfotomaculum nigrificans (strain DSM 14880 / VKM B-2319 / CO-1-SRB) TaxID=868595 RepID=F6B8W9_DESCC|nr:IS21-like element helper ATPase IstB [Desulfotomaculum nigrificans]AEF93620.1 IstB domain protein ATP-binding protein [Desulfotomaculum nigrificans CO-1-SRB]AEF94758.1 IstB domain protein ATP-binding protein [Desulfotomaculum nigrificans CO-1-SRB]
MSQLLSDLCRQLRLAYVSEAVEEKASPELCTLITEVLKAEIEGRKRMKLNRLLHRAGFPQIKTLEGYSFEPIAFPASCNQGKLVSLDWIAQKENVLMLGAVGTGKTHLAIALGVEACRKGKIVRFFRVSDLVSVLQQKHAEGTLTKFRKELLKADLLILDELGYVPFHQTGSELLFHVIADCYERQSVIVTSNLEFGQWSSIFGDTKLTAALVDRLVHHAHILAFSGDSYRLRHALGNIQN